MNIYLLDEPELEFGYNNHIDVRYGITNYHPLDVNDPLAPKNIKIGIIGTEQTISELSLWLELCRSEIKEKQSNQPKLFTKFIGFNSDVGYKSTFILDSNLNKIITSREFDLASKAPEQSKIISNVADLIMNSISYLAEKKPDIIFCAPPANIVDLIIGEGTKNDEDEENEPETHAIDNFRRYLKANSMKYRIPLQIILPHTYSENVKYKNDSMKDRRIQDVATRAWNLFTAIYYKANGTPWRIRRDSNEFTTCYIGIGFYKSQFDETLQTSVAQVFNERGKGVILRGGKALKDKDDKVPHLSSEDAYLLLSESLKKYKNEHGNLPARVVLHKSSGYNHDEIDGFEKAVNEKSVNSLDLLHIHKSSIRLYRNGIYPPLRGTTFELESKRFLLYTRGSVQFYQTYPGKYIPRAIEVQKYLGDTPLKKIAEETLVLTKMNWNNTQFDGGMPITLKCARLVGDILKYVPDDMEIDYRYSFYM